MPDSFDEEIRQLEALLFSDRDPDGRAFVPLADALRRAGDTGRALEVLEEGLGRHPDFASAHVVAGWAHREAGDAEGALDAFSRVVELDDENTIALRAAAELAREAGFGDTAIEFADRLAELEGEAAGEEDEPVGAEEVFAEVVEPEVEDDAFAEVVEPDITDEVFGDEGEPAVVGDAFAQADETVVTDGTADEPEAGIPDEPATAFDDDGEEIVTRTLAEIYVRQGHVQKAMEVYRQLATEDPADLSLTERLAELEILSVQTPLREGAAEVAEPDPVPIASLAPDGVDVLPVTPIASLAPTDVGPAGIGEVGAAPQTR